MKLRLVFSSVLVVGLTLSACGEADQSRTRNAATEICRPPGTEVLTAQLVKEKRDERIRLGIAWRVLDEVVAEAKKALDEARAYVPEDLLKAVKNFHFFDDLIANFQKRIEDTQSSVSDKKLRDSIIRWYNLKIADYEILRDQEGMNVLLVKRADQLNELVEAHKKAVVEADNAFALSQEFSASMDKLFELQKLPECSSVPLLTPADAENYVKEAAEVPVTSTTERKVYQFFDDPAVGAQDSDQPMPEETSSSSSTSSTDPTSETSTVTEEIPVTRETLPIVVYMPPSPSEILEELLKNIEEDPVSPATSSPPVPVGVVDELQSLVDSVREDIQTDPASSPEPVEQTVLVAQEKEKVIVLGSISPTANTSGPDEGKAPVTVLASGFAPNSYVAITDDNGTQVATGTTSENGSVSVQAFTAPVAGGSSKVWIIAGTNTAGTKIAVPVLVKSNEVTSTTTSSENSDTSDTPENTGSSAWFSPRLGILGLLVLLFVAFLARSRRKKSE